MKWFLISSDINTQMAMELTKFFIDCKIYNEEALLIINSGSGDTVSLNQIISAYESSGVHLIAIGMGQLCNCSAAIFCMADERILLPGTKFSLHPDLKDYYDKTGIIQEVFNKKCTNNLYWELSEDDIEQYKVTTNSSEKWLDIITQAIKNDENDFSNYFQFTSVFNSEIASSFVIYLIKCKIYEKNAVVFINSAGGDIWQLNAILNAYKASNVHLTIVGAGAVCSCAAALFCMADERILAPRTRFLLHHSNLPINKPTTLTSHIFRREYKEMQKAEKILLDAYYDKTSIPEEVFEEKCENGADWILTNEEIQKYHITTRSSEHWTDILAQAMK